MQKKKKKKSFEKLCWKRRYWFPTFSPFFTYICILLSFLIFGNDWKEISHVSFVACIFHLYLKKKVYLNV